MKRATLRTLFILGLGAGLGYVAATVPIAPGKTVPAAPAEGAISAPSRPASSPAATGGCSDRANRAALMTLATTGLATTNAGAAQAEKKPNIVIIWGDDVGQSNISAYTDRLMGYRTPNIDRIAREGMKFTDYYGEQSCTAGRAAFITGQHGIRTGLTKVGLPGAEVGSRKEDPTIAELLKPLGYATGQFGKNHLGDRDEHLPTMHGFDEFYGNLYHLNAEEEPELPDYPKDPEFRKKYGPRGVLDCKADGKGGQTIVNTGPLTKKRMETIDDDVAARTIDFIDRQHKAGKPFFLWVNFTHMHFRTHVKPESRGQAGQWMSEYADVMIDHDKNVGSVLDALDKLGLADNTFVMYSTDNGPHTNSWPDGGTTPFRSEKNTNWEGAFRVPGMVRWPGKIKAGTISNQMISHMDWLPTFVAAAGEPDVKEKLLTGHHAAGKTFKVHLDGYNQLPFLTGETDKSAREDFFYFSDDGDLLALRYDNWKLVFAEQRVSGTMKLWFEPFVMLRVPKLFNLRTDPFEFADVTSNTYWDWFIDHVYLLVPAQKLVGDFLATFRDYPTRQKAASFTVDQVLAKLQESHGG
jgi:arylsulfatase